VPYTHLNLRFISCCVLKLLDPEGVLGADLRHFAEAHGPYFLDPNEFCCSFKLYIGKKQLEMMAAA
jgi:hypothetical protein